MAVALFAGGAQGASGGVKTAFAAEAKTPVVVDGVLDEAVWKDAPAETRLMAMSGGLLAADDDRRTDLRLAFDEKFFYVAVTCTVREDLPAVTKADEIHPRPGGGKWENVLELYLDPGRTLNNYTGIFLFPDGSNFGMSDHQHRDPPKGIRYASRAKGNVWTIELAFPADGRAQLGGQWGFNLIRYTPGAGVLGMWRFIPDSFQSPGCFGRVLLGLPKDWFAVAGKRLVRDFRSAGKTLTDAAYAARLRKAEDGIRTFAAARKADAPAEKLLAMYEALDSDVARLTDAATVKTVVPMKEIRSWNCDEWYWEPFAYSDTVRLSKQVAAGETPTYEYKGPIVRKCEGWYPSIGRAVEGVKGSGLRLMPRKDAATFGIHGSFGGIFDGGKRYRIEGYLKGKGSCNLITLYYCIDTKTGATKLHRPVVIHEAKLTDAWTKFETEFELPPLPEGLAPQKGNPLGITVPAETDFAVDELRIWEL